MDTEKTGSSKISESGGLMKKWVVVISASVLAAGFALGGVTGASAGSRGDDAPPLVSVDTVPVVAPYVKVFWLMPESSTPIPPTGNNPTIWPQDYAPDGATECDRWYQWDVYPADVAAELIADKVLTEGEDYGLHATLTDGSGLGFQWGFTAGPECVEEPPVVVPPDTTVPVGDTPELAHTGATTTGLIPFGVGFLLSGVSLFLLRRKLAA